MKNDVINETLRFAKNSFVFSFDELEKHLLEKGYRKDKDDIPFAKGFVKKYFDENENENGNKYIIDSSSYIFIVNYEARRNFRKITLTFSVIGLILLTLITIFTYLIYLK